ncbi:tRNA (guanine(46)-N(7))-methyltransferase TrmB [Limoniibacter endophyticus]|uniref:tRNA (guanine-N(7)-)-methyltransferase n=1 Tax=Limoniibacter endophyticus TaxID=1565040 RepID=A0A8J3DH47_9HYPH|nr:tRNA (guanosine(46)-N(7))-methyltransferase TrmB [Limoniibacter endophyticus]GHC69868.1 tRNA (guanine-N(7)-)-methyltransferase [Limoniibacter endophyticus]
MSEDKHEEERRSRSTEAFYGRRLGRPLRETQAEQMEEGLSRLKLDLEAPAPADIKTLFAKQVKEVRLEIGFGGGEHLLHDSRVNPETGLIGIEPFVNGMAKLLAAIAPQRGGEDWPATIRVYNDDATQVLDWLPDACLDGIALFYPDPWPKKRHWKRRFVSQVNLDRFARVLKPGSLFRFASDIDTYVNWTLEHCEAHPAFEWQAKSAADWHTPYENWPGTRYEAKALREGRRPAYLRFQRI